MALLDQKIFCEPAILESICYRTRANRLINEGSTTGGLKKIWTGFFYQQTVYARGKFSCLTERVIYDSAVYRGLLTVYVVWQFE